jgi:uncharacterized protein YbaP (TraB family)
MGFLAKCLLPLLLLLFLPSARGEDAIASLKPKDSGGCFCWSAKAKDGSQLWLLGAVHLGKEPFWPFPPAVEAAWRVSDALVLEMDLSDPAVSAGAAKLMFEKSLQPPEGPSLSQLLGAADAKRLDEALRGEFRSSLANVERMRPWSLNLMLTLLICQKQGWQDKYGIDKHFAELAKERKTKVFALETPAQQVDSMLAVPEKAMAKVLLDCALDSAQASEELELLSQCWRYGDEATISAYLDELAKRHPEFVEELIFARNRRMAEGLKALTGKNKGGSFFVAVGAAHLAGPSGLLELLRKQGYEVRQLPRGAEPSP